MPDPFEVVTTKPKEKTNIKGIIVAVVIILFLILSVIAGVLLVRQNQNVAEKASANLCPSAEACPYPAQKNLLRNCTPPDGDGTPKDTLCNKKGITASCGGMQFCCPDVNKAWTKDLSKCDTASATPTPTTTPTATPTQTSEPNQTATPTSTPVVQSTSRPIPVTGTDWPTVVGGVVGVGVIIASILIAL